MGYYEELTGDDGYNRYIYFVTLVFLLSQLIQIKEINAWLLLSSILIMVVLAVYFLHNNPFALTYPVLGMLVFAFILLSNQNISDGSLRLVLFLVCASVVIEFSFFNGIFARFNKDGFGLYRPMGLLQGPNASALAVTYILYYLKYRSISVSHWYILLVGVVIALTGSRSAAPLFLFILIDTYKRFLFLLLPIFFGFITVYGSRMLGRIGDTETILVSINNRTQDFYALLTNSYSSLSPPDIGIFSGLYFSSIFVLVLILLILIVIKNEGFMRACVILLSSLTTNVIYVFPLNVLFANLLIKRKK